MIYRLVDETFNDIITYYILLYIRCYSFGIINSNYYCFH